MSPAEIAAFAQLPAGAPMQLAAVAGNAQATLIWSPSATTTYTVKRAGSSGGPYVPLADGLTDATYTDTGLTNGVTYYYVVDGANAGGSGPGSAEVSVTPSALRVHLKLDESEGAVAADSSGRSQHAALVNAPGFAAGRLGNAINLAAGSSQNAAFPNGIVSGLTDFTIAAWIKVNAFSTWQRIFDFGDGTANYMFLTTQYTATTPNNAKLRFGIRTPSAAEQSVSGTGIALAAGVWTHVAVIRSGNTVSLYVDGSPAGSGTITLAPSDLGVTTRNYLGKSQWNDPYFNGALDDFRIYERALSPSEASWLSLTSTPVQPYIEFQFAPDGERPISVVHSSELNLIYQLQRSDDLTPGSWINVGSAHTGGGAAVEWPDIVEHFDALDRAYYRVVVHQE
jgi:hypothetical protein